MKRNHSEILLISSDRLLLQTRRLILATYFDVKAAGRLSEAAALLESTSFDLIVLCVTLSDSECRWVSQAVAQLEVGSKILLLTNPEQERPTSIPGDRLPAIRGPIDLLLICGSILGRPLRGIRSTATERPNHPTGDFEEKLSQLSRHA